MKKIIATICLACLVLSLCACGTITAEKAQKIVLKDLGVSAKDVDIDMHAGTYNSVPCYSIYVTIGEETLEYLVDSKTGEILHVGASDHGHSH